MKITSFVSKSLLGAVSFVGLFGLAAHAGTGPATTYNVDITKVELCESAACVNPIVVGDNNRRFNISGAAVGEELESYADLNGIPEGTTISHVRVTLNRALGIAGKTSDNPLGGAPCRTNSADASSSIATPGIGVNEDAAGTLQNLVVPNEGAIGGQPAAGTYAALGITLIDDTSMHYLKALNAPFTFRGDDQPPVIDIAISTATGVTGINVGGACAMFPTPPVVTITAR